MTILIRTRIREDAPAQVCIENVAQFRAPNGPDRSAELLCRQLPESGGQPTTWMLLAALVAGLLAWSLVLLPAWVPGFSEP